MRLATRTAAAIVIAALGFSAAAANAFTLRNPQIVFNSVMLQGYLSAWDGGINANTDQLNAQTFSTGITGNTDFTLMLKNGNAVGTSVGIYNGSAVGTPTLYQLFPSAATSGYYVACHFDVTGSLTVSLFDNNSVYLGQVTYLGVDRSNFGFYITGPNGTKYSQDSRNGGLPQALTYAGTGINVGDYFECLEPGTFDPNYFGAFTGSILVLQSVTPTPVATRTNSWGALKAAYR